MQLEYLDVSEVKVDDSFQSAEFGIENSKVKTRRDRYKSGGELIKFLKRNMNWKKGIRQFEIKKKRFVQKLKKLFYMGIYRPPNF